VVVEGESELVQLASAQLAQLQHVEGHHKVEAGLVQLAGAQLVQLWLDEGVQGHGGGSHCQLVQL
jgi:hypothetical protein